MNSSTISAVTFLYNEEENLENSLQSLKEYVDEIIVYDLESTDKTVEIASKYTKEVYIVPHLICGDSYKIELAKRAKGSWLLWFYGDEVFPEKTSSIFKRLVLSDTWNAYSFMRHEYMDGIRLNFLDRSGRKVEYGSVQCPNYQNRLHKNDGKIYYTELVHAELHGSYSHCGLPAEYYFNHFKTSKGQDFDNIRLYVWYKFLVFKYGNTTIPEYKKYIDSYKKIIEDSEKYNLDGKRGIHPAEEFWWKWRDFANEERMNRKEFEDRFNLSYEGFIKYNKAYYNIKSFGANEVVIDKALKDMGVCQ